MAGLPNAVADNLNDVMLRLFPDLSLPAEYGADACRFSLWKAAIAVIALSRGKNMLTDEEP